MSWPVMTRQQAIDRFFDRLEITESCWLWTGALRANGYALCSTGARPTMRMLIHRFSYELLVGSIPDGLELDHLCRVRHCVNPDHLEPVTHAENVRRAKAAITHCPRGHIYDEKNTLLDRGRRRCRTCKNAANRGWHRRSAA